MTNESLTRETLAAGKGGIWDYVSPSRLGLWLKCPLAFKLKYIDGVEPRPTPGMFIGRMVHKALERWYLHRQLDVPLESRELCNWLIENWAPAREAEGVAFESTAEEEVKPQSDGGPRRRLPSPGPSGRTSTAGGRDGHHGPVGRSRFG